MDARQIINTGDYAGDEAGDSPRLSAQKTNANFETLFGAVEAALTQNISVTTPSGTRVLHFTNGILTSFGAT